MIDLQNKYMKLNDKMYKIVANLMSVIYLKSVDEDLGKIKSDDIITNQNLSELRNLFELKVVFLD